MRIASLALSLLTVATFARADDSGARFTPEGMQAHVTFLADDLLEGRKTASRGHEIAARYVAAQFAAYGLTPGGTDGWYQRITFQRTAYVTDGSAVTISGPRGEKRFAHGGDATVRLNPRQLVSDVSAPLVFVGYGIRSPRFGLDDYRGLDVRGKIVVTLTGFPKSLPSEEGAHLNSAKAQLAESLGAVGLISVRTLQTEKALPWDRAKGIAFDPYFDWVGPDGVVNFLAPNAPGRATLNRPAAEILFAGAPRTLQSILEQADRKGAPPRRLRVENDGAGACGRHGGTRHESERDRDSAGGGSTACKGIRRAVGASGSSRPVGTEARRPEGRPHP